MESISIYVVHDLWKIKEIGWKEILARGASGGILVIWSDNLLNYKVFSGTYSISCLFEDRRDGWR